ncbi:MAG: RDD family protein [Syntrophomonadaceae bacterium]|nr:RDD family protein [Syntrophomonadaceae bacterium]
MTAQEQGNEPGGINMMPDAQPMPWPDDAAIGDAANGALPPPLPATAMTNAAPAPPEVFVVSGLWRRLFAFLIDLAVIGIVGAVLRILLPVLNGSGAWPELLFINGLFLGLLGAAYFIVMTRLTAQTLGKMVMGIRVVRTDGAALDWGTVVMRELVGRSISQLLGSYLGYLTALFTSKRQAPHDMIVDTCVVYDYPGHSAQEVWLPSRG